MEPRSFNRGDNTRGKLLVWDTQASMEPRSFNRGDCFLLPYVYLHKECFNGATVI